MYGILKKKLVALDEMVGTPKEGKYVSVNPEKIIEDYFSYSTDKLVFGNFEDEKYEIDGEDIYHYVTETFAKVVSVAAHPLTLLLLNIPMDYCLHPKLWYCKYREWKAMRLAQVIFENRKKDPRPRSLNVLDLMIKDNAQKPEGKKWTYEEVGGTITAFQLASTDTSFSLVRTLIVYLAQNPDII